MPQKAALVLGSAACLHEDMALALAALDHDPVLFGVNMVCWFHACDHAVTHHPEVIFKMRQRAKGNPQYHSKDRIRTDEEFSDRVDVVWKLPGTTHGTSSMLATRIARAMGHFPVILCGCPLSAVGYFDGYKTSRREFDREGGKPNVVEAWRDHWRAAHRDGYLTGVYSASGWTRDLLGWLPQT